jgi:hypothetical protein
MPADSEPRRELVLPHTWRPFGTRIAATVAGIGLLVVCLFAWLAFPPEVKAQFTPFQKLTIFFFFALAAATWFALVRSRVVARDSGLVVVNGYRTHTYAWPEVVSIRLLRGAPWATLDLADGTSISALALQGSDGSRARNAVRQIRALIT